MPIWSQQFLDQLAQDAEQVFNEDLQFLFTRFYLPIQMGLSVYTLPNFVRTITRITYRGKQLDPLDWSDFQALTPATVWVNSQVQVNSVNSKPLNYVMHPTNIYDIRFFPTP